ncbi:MAG TPA: nucleotidyltransferase domain-containing protein [bacterium]|nr:nucleotidyltransferase domain-containing protein [bacterium]
MKNRNDQIETVCKKIIEELNPQLIYLFGSYAKNKENDESDIDVAVFCKEKIDPVKLFNLQLSLGQLVNRDVDLIDMADIDIPFKIEIISAHYPLFELSSELRYEFEMNTISQYGRFNEEREIIFEKRLGLSGGELWKLF